MCSTHFSFYNCKKFTALKATQESKRDMHEAIIQVEYYRTSIITYQRTGESLILDAATNLNFHVLNKIRITYE